MLDGEVVEQVAEGAALRLEPRGQLGDEQRGADAVLVAHRAPGRRSSRGPPRSRSAGPATRAIHLKPVRVSSWRMPALAAIAAEQPRGDDRVREDRVLWAPRGPGCARRAARRPRRRAASASRRCRRRRRRPRTGRRRGRWRSRGRARPHGRARGRGPSRRAPRGWGRRPSGSRGRAAACSAPASGRGSRPGRRRPAAVSLPTPCSGVCTTLRSRGLSGATIRGGGVQVGVDDVVAERLPAVVREPDRRRRSDARRSARRSRRRPAARSGCRRRGRPCSRCPAAGCGWR